MKNHSAKRTGQNVVPFARGIVNSLDSGFRRNDGFMEYLE